MNKEEFKNSTLYSVSQEDSDSPTRKILFEKYKRIPSQIEFNYRFDLEKTLDYISKNEDKIITFSKHYIQNDDGIIETHMVKCLISINDEQYDIHLVLTNMWKTDFDIRIYFIEDSKYLNKLIDEISEFKISQNDTKKLNLLTRTQNGYQLIPKHIENPDIDFTLNYNEDFNDVHNIILKRLSKDNDKGLVLLHGEPGTGKTTYIRYLIGYLKKQIIYIPSEMSNSLSDPTLLNFLLTNTNSILIIEDAENILTKRNTNRSQAVSNILNLGDGLLSDCLNIQIVATFNTNLSNLDDALLRKGRLIAKYEFKKLTNDRAIKLANKLKIELNGSYTLADIYGAKDHSFTNEGKKIGF